MLTNQSLFKSTSVVSGMTLMSRTLGFIRDVVMASLFGATPGFDAFLVAFKIPNFMRALFAEGSFSQAFVPVLAEYKQTKTQEETLQFIARTIGWLAGVLLLVTLICEVLAPLMVLVFAPGFLNSPDRYQIALHMLRITFPYLMLISLTALGGAVLNSYHHFAVPSFVPVLLNLVLIIAGFYFTSFFHVPEEALAWGVFVAGILQLLFQLPFLWRYKLLPRPKWYFKDSEVRRVMKNLLPALFGVSVMQIGLLIDTLFASFLPEGSISWLYYADRLTFFPLGIFGVALATVVLPQLSTLHTRKLDSDFKSTLDWGLRLILIIGIPAALGLVIMSGYITGTLYKHGQFNMLDLLMTQQSVVAFAIGLPAFMAIKILASAFYARQEIKLPVRVAIVATLLNIIFNFFLIVPFAHVGLAMATSFAAILNAFFLYLLLLKQDIYKPSPGWLKFLVQLLLANVIMCSFLLWGLPNMAVWVKWHWQQQALNLFLWLGGAILIYFCCLWLGGLRAKDLVQGAVPKNAIT